MLRINPKRLFIGVFFSVAASLMPGCSGTYSDAPTSDREDPEVNTATPDPFGIYALLSANQYQGSVLVFDKNMTVISGGFGALSSLASLTLGFNFLASVLSFFSLLSDKSLSGFLDASDTTKAFLLSKELERPSMQALKKLNTVPTIVPSKHCAQQISSH